MMNCVFGDLNTGLADDAYRLTKRDKYYSM